MNNSIHYELINAQWCMEVVSKLAERERERERVGHYFRKNQICVEELARREIAATISKTTRKTTVADDEVQFSCLLLSFINIYNHLLISTNGLIYSY